MGCAEEQTNVEDKTLVGRDAQPDMTVVDSGPLADAMNSADAGVSARSIGPNLAESGRIGQNRTATSR